MAHTVAVFLSFDGELDTQPLIEQLWRAGKRVYLPVLHPFSAGNLLFLNYHPQSELVMNRLKIHEPKLDVRDVLPLSRLDVLITPLVAFDEYGQRLGMGGGFYDRTLQNWQHYKMQPVGYAHDCQLVENSQWRNGIFHCLRWLHRRKSGNGKGDTSRIALIDIVDSLT